MKLTKTVRTLAALANTRRLIIIKMASANPLLTRKDVLKSFGMTQQNTDRHIHILLKNEILVYGPKIGRLRTLKVNKAYVGILRTVMALKGER